MTTDPSTQANFTPGELIQGVLVRVAAIVVPLIVLVFMSIFEKDVVDVMGTEVRGFTIFAIPALLFLMASRLGWDHPVFLWAATIVLALVAMLGLSPAMEVRAIDVIGALPFFGITASTTIRIDLMSLIGVLSISYPIARWLLAYYQKIAIKTDRRIEIKMNGMRVPGE